MSDGWECHVCGGRNPAGRNTCYRRGCSGMPFIEMRKLFAVWGALKHE